jgi:hypothetical protein
MLDATLPVPPRISLGRWQIVVAFPVSDIWAALHAGNLVRAQKLQADDPAWSRTEVYRK